MTPIATNIVEPNAHDYLPIPWKHSTTSSEASLVGCAMSPTAPMHTESVQHSSHLSPSSATLNSPVLSSKNIALIGPAGEEARLSHPLRHTNTSMISLDSGISDSSMRSENYPIRVSSHERYNDNRFPSPHLYRTASVNRFSIPYLRSSGLPSDSIHIASTVRENIREFLRSTDLESLKCHLCEKGILSHRDIESIECMNSSRKKNEFFYMHILDTKGLNVYQKLFDCLKEEQQHSGHRDLVAIIERDLQQAYEYDLM